MSYPQSSGSDNDEQGSMAAPCSCRPFLKWVGGKTQLLPELLARIPKYRGRYLEPFIGGGALFFAHQPRRASLSDINPELINVYKVVRDNVEDLIRDLGKHRYEQEYFYKVRNLDREPGYAALSAVETASRLIFLNKTCYNGLYRVKAGGKFNTPFGRYTNPTIVDADNLRACSAALRNIELRSGTFLDIEADVTADDFIYFDPPYVPLSMTSSFTSYSNGGFDLTFQVALRDLCVRLRERKISFLLSNSSAPFVLELYKDFDIVRVKARRAVNSQRAGRGEVDEVLVT